MIRKSAGEKKKELILNTCKRLFYEKGYANTTFEDIAKEADIYPGGITYHFANKINIAGMIRAELEYNNDELIKKLTYGMCDQKLQSAIELLNYFHLLYEDFHALRFIFEMSQEGGNAYVFEPIRQFFRYHVDEYDLPLNERELDFITASYIGMEREFINMIYYDIKKYPIDEVAEYLINNMYRFLGYDYEAIKVVADEALHVYPQLNVNLDYFKEFKYDKNCMLKK